MSHPVCVPQLPESAPFTAEQRAYLNGFLAGMFSRSTIAPPVSGSTPTTPPLTPLTILFASQTGTCEKLAKRVAKEAGRRGFAPVIQDLGGLKPTDLAACRSMLMITSTYGDGDPPDAAKGFWELLSAPEAPRLDGVRFSVCAMGDSNYPKFCAFGKSVDARLESLGAHRLHPRVDCDVDHELDFARWMDAALESCSDAQRPRQGAVALTASSHGQEEAAPPFSKGNPAPAVLKANRLLNKPGSAKETRHFELTSNASGPSYSCGDALGIFPANCPALVSELLALTGISPNEEVELPGGGRMAMEEALARHLEITRIPKALLQWLAERTGDATLISLSDPNANGELTRFLRGREVIDVLSAYPQARPGARDLMSLLKKLQPRLYSIASSPLAHPGELHLTVSVVRYESLGRARKGVCSSYLADRGTANEVPVFIHENPGFRLPSDPRLPMIMVGPGTGIAPFRGFLHHRRAAGREGRNWLFFGDQRSATDFLYQDELEAMRKDGTLTRLDVAFSRDQEEKIYVQQRMLDSARELFAWLEEGAHFYVCGDAGRMARDVDEALHKVIETGGGRSLEQSRHYVDDLRRTKRYQRDVY